MKILRQLNIHDSATHIKRVSLVENQSKYELWLSSQCTALEDFNNDIAQIEDSLDLAKREPGKVPCNFTFEPKKDNTELHFIFRGNLFIALLFLKEISLESTEPVIDLIIQTLKDPNEIAFKKAFESATSNPKTSTNKQKHTHSFHKKELSSNSDEKTPLLPKPVLVK